MKPLGLGGHPERIYRMMKEMAEHLGTLVFRKWAKEEEQIEDTDKDSSEKVRKCDYCHRNQKRGDL